MYGPEALAAPVLGPPAHAPWHGLTGSESDGHQGLACLIAVMQEACLPPKSLAPSQASVPGPLVTEHSLRASVEWLGLRLQLEGRG